MPKKSHWKSDGSSRERNEPLIVEEGGDEKPDEKQLTVVEREWTALPTLLSMDFDDVDLFASDALQMMGEQWEDPGLPSDSNPGLPSDYQCDSYSDHATDPVVEKPITENAKRKKCCQETFPMILHRLLNDMEIPGAADIIHWQPHGRSFCICNEEALEKFIISRYYHQSSILSFKKQLRNYGFVHIKHHGEDQVCFYHPYFLRGREDLCMYMDHHAGAKRARIEQEKRLKMELELLNMPAMTIPLMPQDLQDERSPR
jgi:hypothetical protein